MIKNVCDVSCYFLCHATLNYVRTISLEYWVYRHLPENIYRSGTRNMSAFGLNFYDHLQAVFNSTSKVGSDCSEKARSISQQIYQWSINILCILVKETGKKSLWMNSMFDVVLEHSIFSIQNVHAFGFFSSSAHILPTSFSPLEQILITLWTFEAYMHHRFNMRI